MNAQQILRVALCAAITALGFASIAFFIQKPTAGPAALQGQAAIEQLKQGGQYESLQTAINQARLGVSRTQQTPLGRPAWHAPNSAAGYDAYVTEDGVSIAVNEKSYVSLSLQSLGYGNALRPVAPGEVSGDKQTINLVRDGGVREWYINGPDGLEHGFTLSEPPGARQPSTPLRLALEVGTGWRAEANQAGESVTLRGPDDQAIEYSKLVVRDNQGRTIPARLTVAGELVVIEAEDHSAEYPLTIDPLFTLQQRLVAADAGSADYFGYAVALDGNTALVGAHYEEGANTDQGAAYVFVRNGATWTQQAKLFAADGVSNDFFGSAVAVSGDTALIGAPGGNAGKGAAYVFTRSGTIWTFQQKLGASDGSVGAQFGSAVALDGHTALVGAPVEFAPLPQTANTGAAYVFTRSGTVWAQQQRLVADDRGDNDQFGFSVALDGDTALIGAPGNTITFSNQGSAYIFTRSGATWSQLPRLTPGTAAAAEDHFGNAVALSGNTALVGAYRYGSDDSGAMFIFRRGATGWTQTDTTRAPNLKAGGHFGVALALDGDLAVVGASLGLSELGVDARSAYVYTVGGEPALLRQFGPETGAPDDRFGYAVAVDGDTVFVGAYLSRVTATAQGAAYAFVLRDGRQVEQQKVFANDGVEEDYLGNMVALDGDTLAVGASFADVGTKASQGAVYVFTRNGASWTFQQKLTANDGVAGNYFGQALALSGNTLAVGAHYNSSGNFTAMGAVYVFTRTGTVWTQQPKIIPNGGTAFNFFGYAVALSGDTLAVGAVGANAEKGAVYIYTRTAGGWTPQPPLSANDGAPGDHFGNAVALDGDTLAVGASSDSTGTVAGHGAAYVFTRSGTVWTQAPKITGPDGETQDYFGHAVALHGDTLAVSAVRDNVGMNPDQGSIYVFGRVGTSWSFRQQLTAHDGVAQQSFGSGLALSGDTLVVGAERDVIGTKSNQGSAYVFTRFGGWAFQQKLTASDGTGDDYFGSAVALNGASIAVGATGDNIGTTVDQGSAYVFAAPACPAFTLQPATLPNGTLGAAYDQQLSTGVPTQVEEFQFSLSSGALPPGLTLSYGSGQLSGTPAAAGTYRFTAKASSTRSRCPATREYVVTIVATCSTLTLNPQTIPNGAVGVPYNQTLTASGGTAPYTYPIRVGSNFPPGVFLNGLTGVISGTPTAPGTYSFVVRPRDANGCEGTQGYSLTINTTACQAITLNPGNLPDGLTGAMYNQTLTASGGTAPYSYALSAGALPNGLSLSPGGALTGIPNTSGAFGFTVKATDANGCQGTRAYTIAINSLGGNSGLQFYPLAHPVRLLDTRPGATGCDAPGAKIAGGTSRTQTAAGRTCDGLTIPATATALVGNATSVQSGGGHFTLYPSDIAKPNSANSNYAANQILNSLFTVRLGASDGAFKIFASTDTDIVVDITGYYAPPSATGLYFHPLPKPVRLLDTRTGAFACFTPEEALQGDTDTPQIGTTTCDGVLIPAGAMALTGNATTVSPQANGFLTLYPSNAARPLIASANFQPGVNLNSPFMVGLSPSGQFNLYVASTTDLVIDVTGYYSTQLNDANGQGLLFNPLTAPTRLLDTRAGQTACSTPAAPMNGNTAYLQPATGVCPAVPAAAKAVVGNATTVNATANGYLTFWPSDANQPFIATSNYRTGIIFNRHFTVGLGSDGAFKRYAAATTDLVIDLVGYFAP